MDKNIKICVIDTYIEINHDCFKNTNCITINSKYSTNIKNAETGHGTAVCDIILQNFSFVDIELFPVFLSRDNIDIGILIDVLIFIYNNIKCDIINLSCGILFTEQLDQIKKICDAISKSGTIIVSAFDNSGIMTIPACFESVIGIDISNSIVKRAEYTYVKNSSINILGYAGMMKLAWSNNKYILASGTSFITPSITSLIAQYLYRGGTPQGIYKHLESNAYKVIEVEKKSKYKKYGNKINKAVTFPFNKEMHALIKFQDLLDFEICDCYDIKYSNNIGRKASNILKYNLNKDFLIKNIEKVCFDNIDTIIIGHMKGILKLVETEFIEKLLMSINKNSVNIYSYDEYIYDSYYSNKKIYSNVCFFPGVSYSNTSFSNLKKMWPINKPVVNIMGTKSKQGKYTLQLNLIKQFRKEGYNAQMISTEPNGWLLGAAGVFPFGYNSTVKISVQDSIIVLNDMLHSIELEYDPDIIICSSQSSTIPYNNIAYKSVSIEQAAFLYGTNPDATILCVSMDDELEYIERTKKFIEAVTNNDVIAIMVYPKKYDSSSGFFTKELDFRGTEEISGFIEVLKNKFQDIAIYELIENSNKMIFDLIVDFFNN